MKTNNHSTAKIKAPKKETSDQCEWLSYLDPEAHRFFPGKGQWLERMCMSFLKWAYKSTSLDIGQFLVEYKMPRTMFYKYLAEYEQFKKVHQEALYVIATRRKVGGITRKYSDNVYKDLYKFDPEWKDVDEYQAKLKAIQKGADQKMSPEEFQQLVMKILTPVPKTDVVPEKRSHE